MTLHFSDTPEDMERLRNLLVESGLFAFVTGCYDGLHEGHRRLFSRAVELGSRVVVAVNPDEYIRRHKRPNPMFALEQRLKALEDVEGVFATIVMHDELPCRLIETLKPDYFVLGPDYNNPATRVAEAALRSANAVNCKVFICDDNRTISSSEIYTKHKIPLSAAKPQIG